MKRIRREFVKYVAMNVSGMMGLSIYILADTYFIANRLGADGLAALNLALPAYNLVNGLGLMLGIGGAARFIIVRMEGSRTKSHQIFTTAAATGVILGIALAGLGAFYSEAFAGLLGAKGHVLAMTDIYLKMIWIFSPAFILNNILSAFVKNDGNPGLAMVAMLAGGIPSLVMELTSGLVMIILNLLILGLAGSDGVAAYGVMANLLIIVIAAYNGIAQGAQPLFGAMYGRGDRSGIARRMSVLKGFALPIPLAFCLSHALGLKGIWSVLTVTELMVFVMGGIAKRNASHKVQSLE